MKTTILLVDDNPELLQVLGDELGETYTVVTAANGQEAMTSLEANTIQAIVCDVNMPVMDGFEFCRNVKSKLMYSYIPIILLTARNTLQSKITGLELGADAYLEKPFSVEHLLVQLANLISNRNKLRDYYSQPANTCLETDSHSPSDQQFLDTLNSIILDKLDDPELNVEMLAELMNTSRTSLFRKISSLYSLTPNELVNVTRLNKAAILLKEANHKIYEIAYMVGFNSQTSFGRSFYKQFGMSPTEYQKQFSK